MPENFNTLHCTACGHIAGRFVFTMTGRKLQVLEKMEIRILDKEMNRGALVCSECKSAIPIDLAWMDDL